MNGPRTEIAIEHLLLEGVQPADAHLVGAALELGLARLVRERGVPDAPVATTSDVRVSLEAQPGESPATLGARVAAAIYGRLSQ
jgi:hypothetical protein